LFNGSSNVVNFWFAFLNSIVRIVAFVFFFTPTLKGAKKEIQQLVSLHLFFLYPNPKGSEKTNFTFCHLPYYFLNQGSVTHAHKVYVIVFTIFHHVVTNPIR